MNNMLLHHAPMALLSRCSAADAVVFDWRLCRYCSTRLLEAEALDGSTLANSRSSRCIADGVSDAKELMAMDRALEFWSYRIYLRSTSLSICSGKQKVL